MRHENESTMMPPTRGPMMVRPAVAADHSPKARARASPWKLAVMSDRGPGTNRAPAAPWNSRKTMSHSIVGARPHSADESPNAASPMMKIRRRPYRSASAPARMRNADRVAR